MLLNVSTFDSSCSGTAELTHLVAYKTPKPLPPVLLLVEIMTDMLCAVFLLPSGQAQPSTGGSVASRIYHASQQKAGQLAHDAEELQCGQPQRTTLS
jgi:hypothetical protein